MFFKVWGSPGPRNQRQSKGKSRGGDPIHLGSYPQCIRNVHLRSLGSKPPRPLEARILWREKEGRKGCREGEPTNAHSLGQGSKGGREGGEGRGGEANGLLGYP